MNHSDTTGAGVGREARMLAGPQPGQDVADQLALVEGMIRKLARQILRWADAATLEDAVQGCRVHLWQTAIPKYKPRPGAKMSTYLHACSANWLRSEARSIRRRSERSPTVVLDETLAAAAHLHGRDETWDGQVVDLADQIMRDGAGVLRPDELRTLRTLMALRHEGRSDFVIARRMGVSVDELHGLEAGLRVRIRELAATRLN